MKKFFRMAALVCLIITSALYAEDDSSFLIFDEELYTGFTNSTISASNVNIREKADTGSRVITRLNKGKKVKVLEVVSETVFVDKYFGSWLKLELPGGKEGYVLSCFVSSPQNKIEPFHVFFEKFRKAWQKKNMKEFSGYAKFPVLCLLAEEGEVTSSELQQGEFFSRTSIKEPYMYPLVYEKESSDVLVVAYGYEAQQYTLYFAIINKKWTLFKMKISSC